MLDLVGIAVAAFVATNIDDILILMVFFSASNYDKSAIVAGQFLGIGLLVALSTLGVFLAVVVPNYVIALLGIAPIAIGIKKLLEQRNQSEVSAQVLKKKTGLALFAVAGVTIANGGDNIGVYAPLFANYNSAGEVATIVSVFMSLTAVWCAIAYYTVNHPIIASQISRVGHYVLPFVLIGLGMYLILDGFL